MFNENENNNGNENDNGNESDNNGGHYNDNVVDDLVDYNNQDQV